MPYRTSHHCALCTLIFVNNQLVGLKGLVKSKGHSRKPSDRSGLVPCHSMFGSTHFVQNRPFGKKPLFMKPLCCWQFISSPFQLRASSQRAHFSQALMAALNEILDLAETAICIEILCLERLAEGSMVQKSRTSPNMSCARPEAAECISIFAPRFTSALIPGYACKSSSRLSASSHLASAVREVNICHGLCGV